MITQAQSDQIARFILCGSTKDEMRFKKSAFHRIRDFLDSYDCPMEIECKVGEMQLGAILKKAFVCDGIFWVFGFVGNKVEIIFVKDEL